MSGKKHWFISTGEFSGDLIAAEFIRTLRNQNSDLSFSGITGPALEKEGVLSVANISELSMMGLTEVLGKLPYIIEIKQRILDYIDRHEIKVAVLVDFAGFHLKLAEELKLRGVYVIQYVAPKFWAWGEGRVKGFSKKVDLLLTTFPFEEKFFRERGVHCHYLSCPYIRRTAGIATKKSDFGLSENTKLVALLPGSRSQEVDRILPSMLDIANLMRRQHPNLKFIVPIAPSLSEKEKEKFFKSQDPSVEFVEKNSLELMSAADFALVASGTATLECALLGTPLIVLYKMNALTHYIARKKVTGVKWASLVNILSERELVTEYIQNYSFEDVAEEALSFLLDSKKSSALKAEFLNLRRSLEISNEENLSIYLEKALDI